MGRATEDELADLLGPAPAEEPKPLTGRELYRLKGSRQITGPARVGKDKHAGRAKFSPERLRMILKEVSELPIVSVVCERCGISRTALKYWLAKSEDGVEGDGFDIVINPNAPEDEQQVLRFHEAYNEAMDIGIGRAEKALFVRATGYEKVLTYQGRVSYKEDPALLALGFVGPEARMLDKNGNPIPETIFEQDSDCLMFMLKARKPEVYGSKQSIDVTHRGGVLVVSAKAKTGEELNVEEEKFRTEAIDVEFEEVEDENA